MKKVVFVLVVLLSGCTVHFGVDYNGKSDISKTVESPNYRRAK